MRKFFIGVALALFTAALGIEPASATSVKLLSGTAAFDDSGTAQVVGTPPGCSITTSVDGAFSGSFVGAPVNTPVDNGSFHMDTCANFISPELISGTGTATVRTLVGTVTATGVGTLDFFTGALNETWTVTGGTGAYTNARGTITMTAQRIGTSNGFADHGSLSFNVVR